MTAPTEEAFYNAEHPRAEAAAERFVTVTDGIDSHIVSLETAPDSFVVIARETTRARAERTADCFRLVFVDVLIAYAAERAKDLS